MVFTKGARAPRTNTRRVIGNHDDKSSRISARICKDVSIHEETHPGARIYWAYGYKHLQFLLKRTKGSMRAICCQHKLAPASLASIITYAASDPRILAHCRQVAEWQLREKISANAANPRKTKHVKPPGEVDHTFEVKTRGRKGKSET